MARRLPSRRNRPAPTACLSVKKSKVAAGDKLLLQANYKNKAFKATNGELVTVAGVYGGKIRLE